MLIPAAEAFASSSCANSTDRPVPSACAACAGKPEASSSVSVAFSTPSTLPKNSTSRLDRVGPRPGVRVRASHAICPGFVVAVDGDGVDGDGVEVAMRGRGLLARLYAFSKNEVKVMRHSLLKFLCSF